MPLPSQRDIQTRLFVMVGVAAFSMLASGIYAEVKTQSRDQVSSEISEPLISGASTWDEINLETGLAPQPEDDVAMARSGILSDFEAR